MDVFLIESGSNTRRQSKDYFVPVYAISTLLHNELCGEIHTMVPNMRCGTRIWTLPSKRAFDSFWRVTQGHGRCKIVARLSAHSLLRWHH
jgi:hypothetical protein